MGKSSLNNTTNLEWSVLFDVDTLTEAPHQLTLSPPADSLERISQRLNIDKIINMSVDVTIEQEKHSHLIQVSGVINAEISQHCVVTLEPITNHIHEEFEGWYADRKNTVPFASAKAKLEREQTGVTETQILEERDDPEPLTDGHIELGELIVQHLSLAIDPYPIAEGVEEGSANIEEKTSPFAELKNIRFKDTNEG